jgi:putative flippase GtrA
VTVPVGDDPQNEIPGGMTGADGPLLKIVKDRRIAFLLVGGFNTVVGFGFFTLFLYTIGEVAGYLVALFCAHIASVLVAFVMYRKFVFRVTGHVWRDLLRFEMVYLVALGVNTVLLPLLVEVAHLEPLFAQALIVGVTTVISYVGHRSFSFRRKEQS